MLASLFPWRIMHDLSTRSMCSLYCTMPTEMTSYWFFTVRTHCDSDSTDILYSCSKNITGYLNDQVLWWWQFRNWPQEKVTEPSIDILMKSTAFDGNNTSTCCQCSDCHLQHQKGVSVRECSIQPIGRFVYTSVDEVQHNCKQPSSLCSGYWFCIMLRKWCGSSISPCKLW